MGYVELQLPGDKRCPWSTISAQTSTGSSLSSPQRHWTGQVLTAVIPPMSLCLVLLRPSGINDHGHHLVLFRNACTYKRISQVLYEAHAISVLTEHPHCPFPDKKAAAARPGHYSWFLNSYPRIQWLGRITEDQSRKKRNISFAHPHSHVIPQCSKSICPDCHKHGRRIRIHIFFVRVLKAEKIKQRVKRCWVGVFFFFFQS